MSHDRNIPTWVSARLEASHFGASDDRCDCFTYDPLLPPNFPRYTTADYPAPSEIIADFERGRLLPSAELTASDGDNKFGYLFSNVVPMAHSLRVGAWAALETHLGGLARNGKDVYMIAGAAGSAGTVKNQDRITIPASVWKVAVILPHGQGRADVHTASDLEVIAVIMPNDASANVDWMAHRTTVDAVEALSGYDLLALLPDQIEIEVESGSRPAVAALDGPYVGVEGSAVAMSAEGSSDPDGDAITAYDWAFGDGSTGGGTGAAASHTYAQQGVYTVTLTVTESHGLVSSTTSTVTVANVAPAIGTFAGATVSIGETYTASGVFTDPGADSWTATVDYGDGASMALALSGNTFELSHAYSAGGSYTVTVTVSDGTESASRSQTVIVRTKPTANANGPYTSTEGASIDLTAAGSADPDGSIQSYAWDFGDGTTGSGAVASHTYAQDGAYSVTLTVTDNDGLTGVASTNVVVSNVAPQITFAGGNRLVGETYTATGTFTDPGADTWTATVDYGDGAAEPLALDAGGRTFTLSHVYATPGRYSVVVDISDGTTTSTSSALVVVRARPVAAITGVLTSTEGASVALSGAASSDADGTIQSHVWNFGDGSTASGPSVSHTYTRDGAFVVALTVTDNDGLTDVSTATVQVQNVAPVVSALPAGAILEGESYSANGSFTDPGDDPWTATVHYGEGQTVALVLTGKSFTLSHTYALAGTFTIAVRISDDDTTTLATAVVTVMGVAEALQRLDDMSPTSALKTRMDAVLKHFDRSQSNPTITQLNGYLTDLDTAVRTGQITAAQAAPLRDLAQRIIAAL